jgi:cellulose synthase/poly-beta-1,6-N-acetylglucosamine synthase-like glycosyltransferase
VRKGERMIECIEWILIITTSLYCIQMLIFTIGLFFPNIKRQKNQPFVSVIIAARNEEKNIPHVIRDLKRQDYPSHEYEVILVDDFSSDSTRSLVEKLASDLPNFRVISSSEDASGRMTAKKNALQQGIEASRGAIILTADADCRLKPGWITGMVSYFDDNVGMIVGFSQIGRKQESRPVFEQLQALDFLALLSAAQGSLNLKFPLAATGQNLAYRREAFNQVGGYQDVGHRISGDDVLLLQLIAGKTDWDIRFAPDAKCFNRTNPEKSLKNFLNQRRRWASNGLYQLKLNKLFFLIVLNTFILNLLLTTGILLSFFIPFNPLLLIGALTVKLIFELFLIIKGARKYGRTDLIKYFPIWALLQIPYIVLAGSLGNIGRFTWKGRVH